MANIYTHALAGYTAEVKELLYGLATHGYVIKDYTEAKRKSGSELNITFKTDCPQVTLERLMPRKMTHQKTTLSTMGQYGGLQRRVTDVDTQLVE